MRIHLESGSTNQLIPFPEQRITYPGCAKSKLLCCAEPSRVQRPTRNWDILDCSATSLPAHDDPVFQSSATRPFRFSRFLSPSFSASRDLRSPVALFIVTIESTRVFDSNACIHVYMCGKRRIKIILTGSMSFIALM